MLQASGSYKLSNAGVMHWIPQQDVVFPKTLCGMQSSPAWRDPMGIPNTRLCIHCSKSIREGKLEKFPTEPVLYPRD